ncbi:MAG: FAD-dependent oxidoreductase, partial [Myxococcota bacterium]
VVVIGGGLVGLELAEFLVERDRSVVVLESGPRFGLEMAHPRRWRALDDLRRHGVTLVANAHLHSIGESDVSYEIRRPNQSPEEADLASAPADTVILAIGLDANPDVVTRLATAGVPIREIGDVTGVGYLEGAIHDGFHAGLAL